MRKLISLISFLSLAILSAQAQESAFSRLRDGLDDSSLALVNIETEATLGNDSYVSGVIEISDYQKRTDPGSRDVRYNCQVIKDLFLSVK